MSSTTPEIVKYLKDNYGGYVVQKRKQAKAHHRFGYQWSAMNNRALHLLSKIVRFLKEPMKRRRALLLLAEYKKLTRRNGKYTPGELEAKRDFERRFFELSYTRQHSMAA